MSDLEQLADIRFMNEVCLSVNNGFENNVKFIKDVLVSIEQNSIIILPQKSVPKKVIVPMTNIASYTLKE